jgi:hypothetical protein
MRARTFFLSELEELNADLLLQVVALVDKAVRVMSGLKNTQSNRLVVDGDIVLVGGKKEPAWCNLPIYILYMKLLLCSATEPWVVISAVIYRRHHYNSSDSLERRQTT